MTVPDGAVNQTPSPAVTITVRTTPANLRIPASAAMKPRTSSGTLLEATCCHPACRKADGTTSSSSAGSRGEMP